MTRIIAATAATGLTGCAGTSESGLARLETLLARHDSATLALEEWCRSEGIAEPKVLVSPIVGASISAPEDLRERLGVSAQEQLSLRHVRLSCGALPLSQAYNWFVPSRLTPEMNDALASTSAPFGKIAAPLRFRRERIVSRRGAGPGCPAGTRLFQRALLRLPDGRPLALVEECYVAEGFSG